MEAKADLLYGTAVIKEMGVYHIYVVQLQTGETSLKALPDLLAIDGHA